MTLQFYCKTCDLKFEAEGFKYEYNSPLYGPCWKMMAHCPDCKEKVDEHREPNRKKQHAPSVPACGMSGGACGRPCGM